MVTFPEWKTSCRISCRKRATCFLMWTTSWSIWSVAPKTCVCSTTYFAGSTIKRGAGFLNATELVTLCHLTESLRPVAYWRDAPDAELMDTIMAATQRCAICSVSWRKRSCRA